ncbi:MAG: hypothetical protein L0271_03950 [Gemmatimonadetes bacterium]|nr:hypothetical protein [Gemmatimonadota bacterium]
MMGSSGRFGSHAALAGAIFALLNASQAAAQSLFATRGMGLPVHAVDARARGLGGIGVGLLGFHTSIVNPAEIGGLSRRGVSASLQPTTSSSEVEGQSGEVSGARFPGIRILYPFSPQLTVSLGYGGFLEQSWGIQIEHHERIGSDSIAVRDVIQSTGGVAQLSLAAGWAGASWAVGGAVGLYTGNLDRRVSRTFADTASDLVPFDSRLRWRFRGPFATVGGRVDIAGAARIGASVTTGGELEVDGLESAARDDETSLPARITVGASALLSSLWLVSAGAEWAGVGGEPERAFNAGDALALRRNTWRIGGGAEYAGIQTAERSYPLRIGGSYSQLPYYNMGETPATEWSASLGMGFRLAGDAAIPLAVADVTLERGRRSGLETAERPGGLTESFWRFTFTLSLFGQ